MVKTKKQKPTQAIKPKSPKPKKHVAKKRTKIAGTKIHAIRTRISRRDMVKKHDQKMLNVARRTIIAVIVLAMLAVILAILASIFYKPETIVTNKISSITADYYENYFYPRVESYGTTDKTIGEIMSRYTESGFSKITLRQLLLFDSERYADAAALLTEYCDPELTYVKIFPDEPFTKSDYHVDYHYACTF